MWLIVRNKEQKMNRINKRCIWRRKYGNLIYSVLVYKIDIYFHEYNLAIEADELGHNYRNIDYEIQRQKEIEKELDSVFIRINPDRF